MLESALQKRNIPDLLDGVDNIKTWFERKEKLKQLICETEYGFLPPMPDKVTWQEQEVNEDYCAGKALYRRIILQISFQGNAFSFPVDCVFPRGKEPVPAILSLNFQRELPNKYLPTEELVDLGVAVISFCYLDVCADNADFSSGLANLFFQNGERRATDAGKIALWAWAAMRVMDYLQTVDEIDHKNIAVAGHSRLGKTALFTAAFDDRFAFAFSNNSGCCGAALSRGKTGEQLEQILEVFPFWFCKNFRSYANREETLLYDQHLLPALIAPRNVYVASAQQDLWADPISEFLGCAAATPVYRLWGLSGLITPDQLPIPGDVLHKGEIGYHMRSGTHFLSRYDWAQFIAYMKQHKK